MRRLFAAVALLLVVAGVVYAADASAVLRTNRGSYFVTVSGTSGAFSGQDVSGKGTKRAAVIAAVVSGQAVKILLRFEEARGGVYVDALVQDTLANLTTAVEAMDLSTARPGHPSPVDDAVDASAISVAGG